MASLAISKLCNEMSIQIDTKKAKHVLFYYILGEIKFHAHFFVINLLSAVKIWLLLALSIRGPMS